jgi:ADP-heptose:LPS heptosyltransferase
LGSIKNFIKHVWFGLRDLSIRATPPIKLDSSLVIVRLDAIGDYILFRNFLEIIKKSDKYKNHHISLIGNKVWKPIAEKLDCEWVDRFIWVDLIAFHKSLSARKEILSEIEDSAYDILFHPTYSRDYYISEVIAKRVNASVKLASVGDFSNTTAWQKKISDKHYTKLFKFDKPALFEFYKNKQIVSTFLKQKIDLNKTQIDSIKLESQNLSQDDYILLFIGGGAEFRKWSNENWINLITNLLEESSLTILLAGGPQDKNNGLLIKNSFKLNERIINACGKTSLLQLMSIVKKATMLVSNETSAPHIAVALNTPVLVLSNGNHYGRFTPYPKEITSKYNSIFPLEIEAERNETIVIKNYSKGSNLPVNDIYVEAVIAKINRMKSKSSLAR